MSALQKLIEKQARGETMTSLEFAVYWCSDMVASVNAADELATLRAERDEAVRLLKEIQANEDYCIYCKVYGEHDEYCKLEAFLMKVSE